MFELLQLTSAGFVATNKFSMVYSAVDVIAAHV